MATDNEELRIDFKVDDTTRQALVDLTELGSNYREVFHRIAEAARPYVEAFHQIDWAGLA